jgi:hypothetical protein
VRYIAAAFVAGFCVGWFLRRRSKGGNDLPPLLLVVIHLFTQFVVAGGGGSGPDPRRLLDAARIPARRAWTLEQQVSECRRHAFSGRVGEDSRACKAFLTFVRARWDLHAGATAYAALHWLRCRRAYRK